MINMYFFNVHITSLKHASIAKFVEYVHYQLAECMEVAAVPNS